jgi:hypothetical protein
MRAKERLIAGKRSWKQAKTIFLKGKEGKIGWRCILKQ